MVGLSRFVEVIDEFEGGDFLGRDDLALGFLGGTETCGVGVVAVLLLVASASGLAHFKL